MDGVEPQLNAHIEIGKHNGLTDKQVAEILILTSRPKTEVFALGEPNVSYAQYFKGNSYLKLLTKEQVHVANVTFAPKHRNSQWRRANSTGHCWQRLLSRMGKPYKRRCCEYHA